MASNTTSWAGHEGMYDNDPRVHQVNDGLWEIPDPAGRDDWVVERHELPYGVEWRARATHGEYANPPYHEGATAEETIWKIIGEPES